MAKKIHIVWRKATEEELEKGCSEMVIHEQHEIECEDECEDNTTIAFKEFMKMTPDEIEYLKYALGVASQNKSSIRVLQNGSGEPVIVNKASVSCWKKLLIKIGILKDL